MWFNLQVLRSGRLGCSWKSCIALNQVAFTRRSFLWRCCQTLLSLSRAIVVREFYFVLLAPGSASGLDIVLWNSCIILNQVCSSVSALVMPDVAPAVKGDRSLCCWIPGSASGLLATLLEGSGLCNSSRGFPPLLEGSGACNFSRRRSC